MKKSNCISVAVLSLILLFALVPVNAQVNVTPTSHDFGAVNVGDAASTIITITNNNIFSSESINSVTLTNSSTGDFYLLSSPSAGYILDPGTWVDIIVEFSPTSVGNFSTYLTIVNGGTFDIPISGTGVGDLPLPDVTILDIIQFFEAAVDSRTLFGVGPTNSAQISKIKVFRKILWDANHLLEGGNIKRACDKLNRAYNICDGLRIPNDFVQGNAVSALSAMISQYISLLGC